MRRILNPLLGRTFKSSNFRRLIHSAFTRLQSLNTHRRRRYSQDRDDVVRLLQQDGLHNLALSRCEQVIKHQNLLDAYGMIEGYLNLLMDRIYLLVQQRECPDELKEAASGVVYAASRCRDFPELEEIKSVLTSRFGREFSGRAVELRNNSGVNELMMQKLSTRKPNMESKMNLLRAIASENVIALQLHQDQPSLPYQEKLEGNKRENRGGPIAKKSNGSSSSTSMHDKPKNTSPYRTRSSTRKR
ncbi:uncharacterized protein LOC111010490 [Momordica charantia]|uniref:Uncharacterized protein LOC111010490 n=1 Tax=Momordica charantia TaxID=3673 RepID=A0A6J1CEI4_MOMCH|nr:uncharacterized protein LOC111010490 [Momordica charantia]